MNLAKRRGKIIFPRDFLINAEPKQLKALYAIFYPVYMVDAHSKNFFDEVHAYGTSEHFRELEEGESMPVYQLEFQRNQTGEAKEDYEIVFVKAIEL